MASPHGLPGLPRPLRTKPEIKYEKILRELLIVGGGPLEPRIGLSLIRSWNLLMDDLNDRQISDVAVTGCFQVKGRARTYKIYALHGEVSSYCIRPMWAMPGPDKALTAKRLIETDEDLFRGVANTNHTTTTYLAVRAKYE